MPTSRPPCCRIPEYWDVDNPGARLAILICRRACPRTQFTDCAGDAAQRGAAGTVRAGVGYGPDDQPLPECGACGYPIWDTECRHCNPATRHAPQPPARRRQTRMTIPDGVPPLVFVAPCGCRTQGCPGCAARRDYDRLRSRYRRGVYVTAPAVRPGYRLVTST